MEFLNDYISLIVLAFCLGVGYIIKNSLDFIPNKFIPLIMGCIGIVANIVNEGFKVTLGVIVVGLITGLASTGAWELIRNLFLNGKDDNDLEDDFDFWEE